MATLAVDPFMLRDTRLSKLPSRVQQLGFQNMELSPRGDFLPLFVHPRASTQAVRDLRVALRADSVNLASLMVVYRWASSDEAERKAAVEYFRRAIEICVELGCRAINTEFSGRPELGEGSEAALWRSLAVLLPILEREAIDLRIEPHPDDFIEDGLEAVHFISGINHPQVQFIYCAPHTFHMGGNAREVIREAGSLLKHVHIADSLDHRASSGLRFIVNPPGSAVRVHQHTEIGLGDVDFDSLFAELASVGFDGLITICLFGCEDTASSSIIQTRERIEALCLVHGISISPNL